MKTILITALSFITTICLANSTPDSLLYVNASSGLNLRATPGDGIVLKKLDFGDEVKVIDDSENLGYPQKIEWIKGQWIKIQHKSYEGYVFDGFLTSLPNHLIYNTLDYDLTLEDNFYDFFAKNYAFDAANCSENGSMHIETLTNTADNLILTKVSGPVSNSVSLEINDLSALEMYHFILSIADKHSRKLLLNKSTFREGSDGQISTITVQSHQSLQIKKDKNRLKVSITYHEGC